MTATAGDAHARPARERAPCRRGEGRGRSSCVPPDEVRRRRRGAAPRRGRSARGSPIAGSDGERYSRPSPRAVPPCARAGASAASRSRAARRSASAAGGRVVPVRRRRTPSRRPPRRRRAASRAASAARRWMDRPRTARPRGAAERCHRLHRERRAATSGRRPSPSTAARRSGSATGRAAPGGASQGARPIGMARRAVEADRTGAVHRPPKPATAAPPACGTSRP